MTEKMSDAEMVAWLKEQSHRLVWAGNDRPTTLSLISKRLEQLTTRDKKSPLTPKREAEIRERLPTFDPLLWNDRSVLGWVRDLLAAHDHERKERLFVECQMQDFLQEPDSRFDAGVREERARVLGLLREAFRSPDKLSHLYNAVEADGRAELPPHAQTYAECQRLKAALAEIVEYFNVDRTALGGE